MMCLYSLRRIIGINLLSTRIKPFFSNEKFEFLKWKVVIWLILPVAYAYLED